ncbi:MULTISPECIES: GNAT family N-acetyltransferase [unclassified Rathayibacter]|uniref:GNAT family N-acetyltransferase n=1 Tax=unclassified Rathayibacter TaxID=2609250 RepID=UPI00188B2B4F|nr:MULTISPECIES: GNAT family N-acetyltransferase [unclassified Rathayibacter]MBF4461151.1 GNAT family N-acetyltransferase [Rathayibacter sp. VKM Ac-2879]MBF4502562.1 GNAT family N-acetyltransferase [Rathayibacter sp. VKM Ac-2878]
MSPTELLRAYDEQLRTGAETPSAVSVTREGPLRLVTFAGGRGFVTYRDLAEASADDIAALVAAARAHFEAAPSIRSVEWKTRGHDRAPGLHEALLAHGFVPRETESIMVGPLSALVRDAPLPEGARVRRVGEETEVRAMSAMVDAAFGEDVDIALADALLARLARGDGMELWVAEVDGRMVAGGRLEPVAGSDFAGIWGGATLPDYRGRGLYRAVTTARAASALELGKSLVHSDSTEYSRPILERAGLTRVSTTTPYVWRR